MALRALQTEPKPSSAVAPSYHSNDIANARALRIAAQLKLEAHSAQLKSNI